jgi:hypothetical protein
MNGILKLMAGLGIGALLMYLFDPKGGGRRRALIRDKAVGLSNDIGDMVSAKSRDLSNRAKGVIHEAKSMIPESETGASDQSQRLA